MVYVIGALKFLRSIIMKTKSIDPKELCLKLLKRSSCAVQVGSVLTTKGLITATGWNHAGSSGYGCHAEEMTFKRSNHKNIPKSVLYVAARRKKSKNPVTSRPCAFCWQLVKNCAYVIYRDKDGEWKTLRGSV